MSNNNKCLETMKKLLLSIITVFAAVFNTSAQFNQTGKTRKGTQS
jgi:hypothetical protein